MNQPQTRCVIVSVATQKENSFAEFIFPSAQYLIEQGTLRVLDGSGQNLMAIAAGHWQAVWIADPVSKKPLGLFDASKPELLTPSPQNPPSFPPQNDEHVSLASKEPVDDQQAIIDFLQHYDYRSLSDFAQSFGQPLETVERTLSSAMSQNLVDFHKLTLQKDQQLLDIHMPGILATQPKTLPSILII